MTEDKVREALAAQGLANSLLHKFKDDVFSAVNKLKDDISDTKADISTNKNASLTNKDSIKNILGSLDTFKLQIDALTKTLPDDTPNDIKKILNETVDTPTTIKGAVITLITPENVRQFLMFLAFLFLIFVVAEMRGSSIPTKIINEIKEAKNISIRGGAIPKLPTENNKTEVGSDQEIK